MNALLDISSASRLSKMLLDAEPFPPARCLFLQREAESRREEPQFGTRRGVRRRAFSSNGSSGLHSPSSLPSVTKTEENEGNEEHPKRSLICDSKVAAGEPSD